MDVRKEKRKGTVMQEIRKLWEKAKKGWKKADRPVLRLSASGEASLCGENAKSLSFSGERTVGLLTLCLGAAALLVGMHCLFFRIRRKLTGKQNKKKDPRG